MRFRGSFTALATPFKGGKVDEASFQALCDWQLSEGTAGLVPVGTTGESPTLSHAEHKRVVELAVEVARGRGLVIAGAGSNSTDEAIDFARHGEKAGADALLVVCPYYNRPSQEGLFLHFKTIADSVGIPIFIYNIPARSSVDMSVETMARLSRHPNIIGVKDATANISRVSEQRLACGADFIQLTGEDATALGFNAHGGVGAISVTSNVAPRLCAEFQAACLSGDYAKALSLQDQLMPLHQAMFCEPSPGPVKAGLEMLGKMSADVRLPVTPATEAARAKVRAALVGAGLLN
jgi:4-hydroxy-tetrahydrodipicolinate synthase